jgi:hypothetical protein
LLPSGAGGDHAEPGRAHGRAGEAAAPRELRGQYLAAFQYAFTAAGIAAPAIVAFFSLGTWVPWLVVAAAAACAGLGLPFLAPFLPRHAVLAQEPALAGPAQSS